MDEHEHREWWLTPGQVAESLPGVAGRPTHRNTVRRWIERGVVVRGQRIRLAAQRRGGRWLVDPAELARFLSACQASATADAPRIEARVLARAARTAERGRRRRVAAALGRIAAMGVAVDLVDRVAE